MAHKIIIVLTLALIPPQGAHSQDELLSFLIEQNEAAKEKVRTAEYQVNWTRRDKTEEGLRHGKGLGEVKIKGDWRLSTQENNVSIPATGFTQKQTPRMVINDKYLAYWPEFGSGYIYQDKHQSLKKLSEDAKLRRSLHTTPDITSFSFAFGGETDTTFREMIKLHPGDIKWTAEETKQSNGSTVYLIKRFSPFMNDSSKPDCVWTLDPQKGFLVTEAVHYSKAGNIWVTRRTGPKEIGNGIWIPVTYQEQKYGKPTDSQSSQEPSSSTTVQLESIALNHEISDNYFVLASILPEEYRQSTTLFRKGLKGRVKPYVYRNGGYIPR